MDERIEAVQRMQDYIAGHLDVEISMADLAEAARYSPWYAHRLFREHNCWDDTNPRIQLEPRGERGYIELRAVQKDQK